METLQTIKSRRSIRKYTGEKISKDQLDQILTAAQASPVGLGKYKNLH
ncbi:MAG: nitroreductase family protein [Selenomonadaceae bacterium]|nr:nitroreductase family protein [Selenomonadaceae bacterium]